MKAVSRPRKVHLHASVSLRGALPQEWTVWLEISCASANHVKTSEGRIGGKYVTRSRNQNPSVGCTESS